jgi:hypothetical protein
VVSVPLLVRWYLIDATNSEETTLGDPMDGAVYVKEPRGVDFIRVTERDEHIAEGVTIATDERLRAFLRLFEGSTLTLFNDTQVSLVRVRSPRFAASPHGNQIQIRVDRGRVAIGVASPLKRALQMTVKTPHADILLEEGNFSVVVAEADTQVTVRGVRPGKATITANGEMRQFTGGRCRIATDGSIEGPFPPEQNLIVNGEFTAVLDRGWEQPERQRQLESDPLGEVRTVPVQGKNVLAFRRLGAVTHGETSIIQRIDKDVRDFSSLKLGCEVRVNAQSLAGGGYESTEFPVMLELMYRDAVGNPRSRFWGFYYLDPGTGPEWRTMVNGLKVIQGEWYLFETDNLMQSMADLRPVHIDSLRVYASGWDWDSEITNISLLVED